MDENERARVGVAWRAKYGDAIDCRDLRVASLAAVEASRFILADAQSLQSFADFLDQIQNRVLLFMDRPLLGSQRSLAELATVAADAIEAAPSMPRIGRADAPLLLSVARILSTLRETSEQSRRAAEEASPWAAPARSRLADPALDRACFLVGEWIRERHRNQSGHPDGRTSWEDVRRCLEWHGHDLSHIAADRSGALRKRARRWSRVIAPRS